MAHLRVANNDQGIATLIQRLVELKPQLILSEASGGFETLAAASLRQADLLAHETVELLDNNLFLTKTPHETPHRAE